MNRTGTLPRRLGIAALLLGVAGDALLRKGPWGLNAALWIGVLLGAAFLLELNLHTAPRSWSRKALLGIALIFALSFAWRDSPTLKLLSGAMVLVAVALASGSVRGAFSLARLRLAQCVSAGLDLALSLLVVPGRHFADATSWIRTRGGPRDSAALGILRGLLVAAPLLFLFGVLFSSADANFERFVGRFFDFDLGSLPSHAAGIVVCGCVAATVLFDLRSGYPRNVRIPDAPESTFLGAVELNTAMLSIDGLFFTFIAVQAPYFFGGHDLILDGAGMTYAEYARRGFFELVIVAALAFALLLTFDALLQGSSGRKKSFFRLLSQALVLLTAVVIASALHRMNLYRGVYGLTELRLYVTAFILWLAFAFLWLSLTLLRGHVDRLAPGMVLSGFAAALFLLAINPDSLIVRNNIARMGPDREFDALYAASLSADAVPALIERLPDLPEPERGQAVAELRTRWTEESFAGKRTWSWGRHQAREALLLADLLAPAPIREPHPVSR